MKGQLNARMPGLRATRRLGTGGGSAPLGPFPTFAPAFFRVAASDAGNTVEQTDQTFAPADVDVGNSKVTLAGLTYAAFSTFSSAAATRVYFLSTVALPAPLQPNTPYYLSPNGGGGFDIYPETVQADWATTPTMLPEDTPLPAQNYAQRVNKIVLTTQGSGTHRVLSNPLVKILPNLISGGAAYQISVTPTDRHNRFEALTDGHGDKALLGRILARDIASNASYNLYGFGMDQGNSALRIQFQNEKAAKRSLVQFAVIEWRETDTRGLAKVPIAPASVDTTTGVITFTTHQMTTAWRVRLLANANGGTLPAGFSGGPQDYWVRAASANTMTLHPTATDATNNTNIIIPTDQGTAGFVIYAPERPGDSERMRFIAEWREQSTGGNSHTVRTNGAGFTGVNQTLPGDVLSSTGNNGSVGAAGRSAQALVPTNADVAKGRLWVPNGSTAPTRTDTGTALASVEYWIRKHPSSSVYVLFYDNEALCRADAAAALLPAASSCIKFSASGAGAMRIEKAGSGPLSIGVERGGDGVAPLTWQIPLNQKGLLTTVTDYDDPSSATIRERWYWNGVLVLDYLAPGAKGITGTATSAGDTGVTLMNSPQKHVSMEGLLYDLTLGASTGEITASDMKPVNDWLLAKYAIAA